MGDGLEQTPRGSVNLAEGPAVQSRGVQQGGAQGAPFR